MVGSGLLAALFVLAVGAAGGATDGADPADGPPPPLDTIPLEAPAAEPEPGADDALPSEAGPRPIEEPEDQGRASEPEAPRAPDADGDAPRDGEPEASEANEDWIMLGVDYLILFIPVIGGPMIAPLAQGLTHKLGGEALVKNEYPNWWLGTLAGYGVFALAGTAIVGGYALAVIGSIALAPSSPPAAIGAALGGLAVMLAGVAIVLVEPAVFYFVARSGAQPATRARARSVTVLDEPGEDDVTPPGTLDVVRALAPAAAVDRAPR